MRTPPLLCANYIKILIDYQTLSKDGFLLHLVVMDTYTQIVKRLKAAAAKIEKS